MDKLILDFEGDKVEILSALVYIRELNQLGAKVEHNGALYQVVDRVITGVDEVAAEYAVWDHDSRREKELTLTIILEKIK